MASVIGKWKIENSEHFEEYMKAIGISDDKRAEAHKYLSDGSGMTQEFKADGDNWTLTTSTAAGDKTFQFTIGKETDSHTLEGRKVKVLFTVEGDNLVEKQTFDGFDCTHVRHGEGDTLTTTLNGNGKTGTNALLGNMATPAVTGGGRPQVPFGHFTTRACTWVEPPTFRKAVGYLPHVKIRTPPGVDN